MSEFIARAAAIPGLERAVRFARRHRALGVGVLGWHSYLQEKLVPIGSLQAAMLNRKVFRVIRDAAQEASVGRYWTDIGTGEWDNHGRPSEVRVNRIIRIVQRNVETFEEAWNEHFDEGEFIRHRRESDR